MNTTQNCLDLFWHLKNGKIATLDRYFFDAFLPKICAKWSVSTISIPSAEALGRGFRVLILLGFVFGGNGFAE